MNFLISGISILLLFGLNAGLLPYFSLFGAFPNFLLIFVIVYCFESQQMVPVLFPAFFCGLLLDYSSRSYFGSFLFAFVISVFVLRLFSAKIFILEKNLKNLYIIFTVFFIFIYGFVYLYNLYIGKLGISHLGLLPKPMFLTNFYFFEYLYSLPLLPLFRKLILWQQQVGIKHFYGATKKFK